MLTRKFPAGKVSSTKFQVSGLPSLAEWREGGCGWFFDNRESLQLSKVKSPELKDKMGHILDGDVLFFSKTWKPLGLDYDWVTNPETGYRYDARQR